MEVMYNYTYDADGLRKLKVESIHCLDGMIRLDIDAFESIHLISKELKYFKVNVL